MAGKRCTSRRPGVALLMTILLVVLLVSATGRLAATAAVEIIRASRQADTLQHRLAAESALRVVADRLSGDRVLAEDFERDGQATLAMQLADCQIDCRVVNDAAKFNVAAFAEDGQQHLLERKLRELGRRLGLPSVTVRLRAVPARRLRSLRQDGMELKPYLWFDQLFEEPAPGACFRFGAHSEDVPPGDRPVWSDYVTFFGDGRVDLRYAHPEVLRVLLADLDRTAAEAIVDARPEDRRTVIAEGDAQRSRKVRRMFDRRLGSGIDRYAVTVRTSIEGDRRQWYFVAELSGGRVGEIHYRGPIQW